MHLTANANEQLARLRDQIQKANKAYYQYDNPIMDDASYDQLRLEFENLAQQFPNQVEPLAVGSPACSNMGKIHHASPMLSLDNAFSKNDLDAFCARIRKLANTQTTPALCASPKIDGLAVSLRYDHGKLTQGATRGNGSVGEDITANLTRVADIPHSLIGSGWPDILHVRGEIHMYLSEFTTYNDKAKANGKRTFVNPRNAASGEIRRIHTSNTPLPLHFAAYDWIENIATTASQGIARLLEWGMPIVDRWTLVNDTTKLADWYHNLQTQRPNLNYDIDGVVVALDDLSTRTSLGATAHHPRWAIAWKFPAQSAHTKIENILIQVGRTGTLTPVAQLKPVTIGGVTISRASLHNEDEIKRKDIRKGDTALVQRAGDVIPQIVEIIASNRDPNSEPYHLPNTCPECGSPAVRQNHDARRRCTAGNNCPAQRLALLEHFVSRNGIDIDGLGPKQLALFNERGLVRTPADIFRLKDSIAASKFGPLRNWNGFGEKSEHALLGAIESRRNIPLPRFLAALGIAHLGQTATADIATHFGSVENLIAALDGPDGEEQLTSIDRIGPQTAHSLIRFASDQHTRELLDGLLDCMNIIATPQSSNPQPSPLTGKIVVFTGTLKTRSRSEAQEQAKKLGARVTNTISSKTHYLIAGDNPGSKRTRAQKLGITILDEQGWNDLSATNADQT